MNTDDPSTQHFNVTLRDGAWFNLIKGWMDRTAADNALSALTNEVPWEERDVVIAGKRFKQPRLVAWMSDPPGMTYRYSGSINIGSPMTRTVREIHAALSLLVCGTALYDGLNELPNSVFLNLYRSERDSIGMHADDEPCFVKDAPITSLSLGSTRRFKIQHRAEKNTYELRLDHGDLLVMGGTMQQHYQHMVPREGRQVGPRINLTFRHFCTP